MPADFMNPPDAKSLSAVFGRVRQAVGRFTASEEGGRAKRLFALLIVAMLGLNGLNVVNSYVGRDFITSVENRNLPRFMTVSLLYLLVFTACTVVAVYYRFFEERLGILWRDWQTRELLGRYLDHRTYLRLAITGEVDNPDQRIAEDVRAFAATSLSFFLMTVNAAFTVIAFSGVMWSISPLLFAGAVGYAVLGSGVTILLGRHLVGLNYAQSAREATFRAEMIHVRENVEGMAMLRRESRDRDRLTRVFASVITNARRVIEVNRNVSFFTTGYNYLVPVIPVFVVAPLFMRREVEFGVVTQSAMAFAQLMGAFSLIVTQFQSMSAYAAVITRIRGLTDAMHGASTPVGGNLQVVEKNGTLAYEHVTLLSSTGRPLIRDLTIVIPPGRRVLIRAVNNRAKLALFRATAGLWREGEGRITRPDDERIVFLPERPYLPTGTLRDLMVKPGDEGTVTGPQIEAALAGVGLAALPGVFGGLDVEQVWSGILSFEEQALLAAARALLAAPDMVFLDRMSSSLDKVELQRVLEAFTARGISYVALGRMGDETQWFDHGLYIAEDGTWDWDGLHRPGAAPSTGT